MLFQAPSTKFDTAETPDTRKRFRMAGRVQLSCSWGGEIRSLPGGDDVSDESTPVDITQALLWR